MTPETREEVFERSAGLCEVCSRPLRFGNPQVAHRIKKGVGSENHILKYLESYHKVKVSRMWARRNILENKENLRAVCSSPCNDKCNLFFKNIERDQLIDKLIKLTK